MNKTDICKFKTHNNMIYQSRLGSVSKGFTKDDFSVDLS